jgi:flagellin
VIKMPVISTNTAANTAIRYLNANAAAQSDALTKLASGSNITKASDDAAGLAISTKLSSDITTLNQAATNASQSVSVLQAADGGASNISDILQRMKSLATESASGTVTDSDRTYINAEFQQLTKQVDTIASGTRYNGQSLLDGSSAFSSSTGGTSVMIGSNASDTINVAIDPLTSTDLNLTSGTNQVAADLTNTLEGGFTVGSGESAVVQVTDGTNTSDITLDSSLDSDSNGVLDASEIAAAFTSGLTGSTPAVTASYDSSTGALTLSSSSTTGGSSSEIGLSLVSSSISGLSSLSDLGVTQATSVGRNEGTTLDVSTQSDAQAALSVIDTAIDTVSDARATIGAQESRFQFTSDSISTNVENLTASNSAITDVDVASEEAKESSDSVKVQAAVSAVSNADKMTTNLLNLLQ